MTTLLIPKEMDERLTVLAERAELSKEALALQGLEMFLEDVEDYLAAVVAYEDYLQSGKQSISFEEFEEKLQLGEELL